MNGQDRRTREDRYERLLAAARRVWLAAIPDASNPRRVTVSRDAMEALGAALVDIT